MNQRLTNEHLTLLKTTLLFGELPEPVFEKVVQDFRIRDYTRRSEIFHQGDESRSLYVIVSGLVRIFHLNENGDKTTVNFFDDGQIFGEFAVIDGSLRSATAQAVTNCVLLEMSGQYISYHLTQTHGVALAMCKLLVHKARITSRYAETIAQHDAKESLFAELLRYTHKFGRELEPGKRYELDLGLTQEELGTLIGKGRTTVNPILKDAEKRGLLKFEKGIITILDLPRVIREAGASIGE